jgi:hypothetical protein
MSVGVTHKLKSVGFSLLIGLIAVGAGCAPRETAKIEVPSVNSNSTVETLPSPSAAPTAESRDRNIQFTLPLLDALLTDEGFTADAKKEVQLTDQELQKLRDVARNAVLNLNDESEDESRSTKGSVAEARKKVQEALGNDRGNRLISLVQKYGAGEDLPVSKPNLVPDDTRIVVNIPAYRMDIFDDGKLVKTYKIGIGYPEFPLPTGLRKASTMIFNPTWTPPDEAWVKGKVEPGKKVGAGSALNPLGPVKIPIGLPSLIHGGKSPARLGTFASHGCVGLTNQQVEDFSIQLSKLAGEPLTMADIKGYQKAKTETKEVKLEKPVPVELRYETIVVENGTLKIFRDVYERGTNTEEELQRVLENYGVSLDSISSDMRTKIVAALDQMSLTPSGKDPDSDERENTNKSNLNTNLGRVTRNIKGQKEMVFKLPELAGKGYPSLMGLKS